MAADFAAERRERQRRRHLDRADFDRLRAAGYMRVGVPAAMGGLWGGLEASTRDVCRMLRTIAGGDPAVALVAAMHPAVLAFWLARDEVPAPHTEDWASQRRAIFDGVSQGQWWGTITSEPGSGGDILKTRTAARRADDGGWRLTGDKHFGSGSGITSRMITTALPEGEELPDLFFMGVDGVAWDGSTGMTLAAEWDGHGMAATQSHAFRFEGFPATRVAWPGHIAEIAPVVGTLGNALFTAVITGVVDTALREARAKLAPKAETLRAYEQTEWTRAVNECWLIAQAYEGMLRAVEARGAEAAPDTLRAKETIAELAENTLNRMSRVIGGGSYSRAAPFGTWAQDVRALGFLRPPWGLAYDQLFAASFTD